MRGESNFFSRPFAQGKKILADAYFKKHAPRTKREGSKAKRSAQSKVARMMIPAVGQRAGIMGPQKAQVELSGPLLDPYLLVTWGAIRS